MYIKVQNTNNSNKHNVSIKCPHCGHFSNLIIYSTDLYVNNQTYLGQRSCPRPQCNGHLFVVVNNNGEIIKSYPPLIIDFDSENIPNKIVAVFKEALICHSNECYIASAIMIRKTLEEICEERAATGPNLYQKLQDLSSKILIPTELKAAMNELRLLGNDAAHIEAHTFEEVGKEEIEISIEFTKEILKALYQYEGLLDKLRGLKKGN